MSASPPALNSYTLPVTDDSPPPTNEWVEMAMSGRRLVIFPYVFSIGIVTFRRNMGSMQIVETGKWPMGPLVGAALITSSFGWLGIPFGIIFSFGNIFQLWNGGRDLTKKLLVQTVGKQEAKRILSIAPKPQPPATIWLVRLIALLPLVAILSIITFIIMDNGKL